MEGTGDAPAEAVEAGERERRRDSDRRRILAVVIMMEAVVIMMEAVVIMMEAVIIMMEAVIIMMEAASRSVIF